MTQKNNSETEIYEKETNKNIGKSPEETSEDLIRKKLNPLELNELGLPEKEVLVDLKAKDMAAFWYGHQRGLLVIWVVCLLFFLTIIF